MDQPSLVTSAVFASAIIFPMVASLATALRFYVHRITSKKSSLDDWILTLALVNGLRRFDNPSIERKLIYL